MAESGAPTAAKLTPSTVAVAITLPKLSKLVLFPVKNPYGSQVFEIFLANTLTRPLLLSGAPP